MTIKIKYKIPEFSSERHSQLLGVHWTVLREPKNLFSAIMLSIPLMAINLFITLVTINLFIPISLSIFGINTAAISININFGAITVLIALVAIHELLHLVFIPGFRRSDKTYIGITYFGGFVYSEENISKMRYVLITIAPFIIISILLTIVLGSLSLLTPNLIFLILLNSMASSVDILTLILILYQVPSGSYITVNGMKSYWK
ncbi:DUF3267 domain-containing protein [Methanomethylovorans sp.]|uniref:DUF3267 domain-containing protein n=1 Tax=Methanomethylovorans sp. TaxID=2758717 RepID=UPI00351C9614